jgi:hypothetical protein
MQRQGRWAIIAVGATCLMLASCQQSSSRVTGSASAADELRSAIRKTLGTSSLRRVMTETNLTRDDPGEPDASHPSQRSLVVCDGPHREYSKEWDYVNADTPEISERVRIGNHFYDTQPDRPGRFEESVIPHEPNWPPDEKCVIGELIEVRDRARNVVRVGSVYRFAMTLPRDRARSGSATIKDGYIVRLILHLNGDRQVEVFDQFGRAPSVTPPPNSKPASNTPAPTCDDHGNPPASSPDDVVQFCQEPTRR